MAKSKLVSSQSPHSVALSGDGVASRRSTSSKTKKKTEDESVQLTPVPALSRPVRPNRRPVDRVEPVVEVLAVEEPPQATQPEAKPVAPRKPSKRSVVPKGPSLSAAMQERMREMNERLQGIKSQLADVQNKKRGIGARRRVL
jgi:hypothetical protein